MMQKKSLYDFLAEAELNQYHKQFLNDLKVTSLSQVKYVTEDDLVEIGMTKPEIRRLNKFFKKYYHQGALTKLKEILNRGQDEISAASSSSSSSIQTKVNNSPALAVAVEASSYLIDNESVVLHGLLGEGEFASVHQAMWRCDSGNRVDVAVKTIKKSTLRSSVSQFSQLMIDFHSIRHDHIVCLFGIVVNAGDSVKLVMELAHMKSLSVCLGIPSARVTYSAVLLYDFALQVARAMEFLETKNLVHRDLALRNVLVFSANAVKLSDAGLTRAIGVGADYYQRNVSFNLKLPVAWCAPESIELMEFSSFSDVWAFGVTLWEMFSYGFTPWAGFTGKQIALAVRPEGGSQRLDQPDACPNSLHRLMLQCWKHEPKQRPKFSEVVSALSRTKLTRMQVLSDCRPLRSDCLGCKKDDVITVVDDNPNNSPVDGMWKGILEATGRVGFFDPASAVLFREARDSDQLTRNKVARKHSIRLSFRRSDPPRLHSGMISSPQNDLRHVGHVGYDGAVFGDVSFIGQNYDRLPFKVRTPDRSDDVDVGLSTRSLTMNDLKQDQTFLSHRSDSVSTGTSYDLSPGSCVSPGSSHLSQNKGGVSFKLPVCNILENASSSEKNEKNQSDITLDDFNVPDLSGSMELDMNILDEMMRSFGKFDDDTKVVDHKVNPLTSEGHERVQTDENLFHHSKGGDDDDHEDLPEIKHQMLRIEETDQKQPPGDGKARTESDSMFNRQRFLHFELSDPGISSTVGVDADIFEGAAGGGGGGNGMLSKLENVLSKRSEIRMKRSLQNRIPSSSSSSAEILPNAERMHRYINRTVSASLPRDGSLRSSEDGEAAEMRRPMSFLREGRSFSRTKAKIKSSVSSVLGTKGGSKREQLPNINVNLQFFDRLREQELEKELQSIEAKDREVRSASSSVTAPDTVRRPDDGAGGSESRRCDYITRPLGLRSRNFDSTFDTQSDEGTHKSHFNPNLPPGCHGNHHDSSHDSSHESSVTHQSDDGVFADDSELESPEGRVFAPAVVSPPACLSSVSGDGLDGTRYTGTNGDDHDRDHDDRKERYSDRSDRFDYYEAEFEAVLDDQFSGFSPNLEEITSSQVPLNDNLQKIGVLPTKPMKINCLADGENPGSAEHCRAALALFDWDVNTASISLTDHPKDQESPEFIHV